MKWTKGHEKIISFGVSLEVKGTAAGVWCYIPKVESNRATYTGVKMTWEKWAEPIIFCLDERRERLEYLKKTPWFKRDFSQHDFIADSLNEIMIMLFWQNEHYMTLPGEQYQTLRKWAIQYLYDGPCDFPYSGNIPDGDYSFTIDFEKDIEIVKSYDLQKEMAQYNREHNAEHNKEMGRLQTEERFKELHGDSWTTQEILDQGFSRKTLDKFVKYGLIERVKRGYYVRVSV